jgi:SAM-dependent methyltransferase
LNQTCSNCGNIPSDVARQWELKDRRKGLQGSWHLVECDSCNVTSIAPMPTEEQLGSYYAAYAKDDKVDLSRQRGSRHPKLRKLYHRLSGDVDPRDFVTVSDGARVLDYGCGLAGYLADFHDRGVAISGAEIAGYVVEACQRHGFDVHKVDDFSHIPFADQEFDIVYLMQVFEHLRDPHRFMQELGRILKSNGTLYLAVPNAASTWRKVFGANWVSGWYAPFHLFHYNRKTLAELAQQHGFVVTDCWSRTPESWFRLNLKAFFYPSENQLDWRKTWLDSRPVRYLLMLLLRIIEFPFSERDCLVMKLQKQGS